MQCIHVFCKKHPQHQYLANACMSLSTAVARTERERFLEEYMDAQIAKRDSLYISDSKIPYTSRAPYPHSRFG